MPNADIYISRGGQPPESAFSYEETRQLLSTGEVSAEDLAWCEGLPEWYPVAAVVEYLEKNAAAPVPLFHSLLTEIGGPETADGAPAHSGTGARLDRSARKKSSSLWGKLGFKTKSKVTAFELGHVLWDSCKDWSREFFRALHLRIEQMGYSFNDESEFILLEEILVMHVWMISRQLSSEAAAIEVLKRNFLQAHLRVAGTFGSEEEKEAYVSSVEVSMNKRFGLYENLWDKKTPQIQSVLVSHMLKQMFKGSDPHPAPRDPQLLGMAHEYLMDRIRMLHEQRDQYVIAG